MTALLNDSKRSPHHHLYKSNPHISHANGFVPCSKTSHPSHHPKALSTLCIPFAANGSRESLVVEAKDWRLDGRVNQSTPSGQQTPRANGSLELRLTLTLIYPLIHVPLGSYLGHLVLPRNMVIPHLTPPRGRLASRLIQENGFTWANM